VSLLCVVVLTAVYFAAGATALQLSQAVLQLSQATVQVSPHAFLQLSQGVAALSVTISVASPTISVAVVFSALLPHEQTAIVAITATA
jgi:hypothetical protein